MSDAMHVDIDAETYHAAPELTAGKIEDFRESRQMFYGRYVTNKLPPKQPTAAMELGTLVHAKLFEPDKYESLLAPPPPEMGPDGKKWLRRAGSDHERAWNDYLSTCEGKIVADRETLATVDAMVAAVWSHPYASKLLRIKGASEFTIRWTDEETGIKCQCRVDWMSPIPVDVKTTADPTPAAFARVCASLGYHRKRAHYRAGIAEYLGRDSFRFVHIAIGSQPPYLASAYELDDRDQRGQSLGESQRRWTMAQIRQCMETGDWAEPIERQVVTIRLPGFAFAEDGWMFGD